MDGSSVILFEYRTWRMPTVCRVFDVLGFSSLVEANFDGIVKVYDKMIESTAIIEKLRPGVSLRVFSDAFVMASPQLTRLVEAVQGGDADIVQ